MFEFGFIEGISIGFLLGYLLGMFWFYIWYKKRDDKYLKELNFESAKQNEFDCQNQYR